MSMVAAFGNIKELPENGTVGITGGEGEEEGYPKMSSINKIDKTGSALTEMNPDFGQFVVQYPSDEVESRIWPDAVNKEKPLVVVLFGWAGAQDKHLAKYSDIYLSRGCIIVRYTSPAKAVMLDHDAFPRLILKFLGKLSDLELDTHPIFFHLFSNGGGFTYSYLLAELSIGHKHLDIRGTIFDSAPAPREVTAYFKALITIFEPYSGVRYVMAGALVVLLVLTVFWGHMKKAIHFCIHGDTIGIEKGHPTHNWLSRISQYRNHNFLFIYSDADDIIRSHQVEKFANFIEERENCVRRLKFTDSLHVLHYRKYPKEYVDATTTFIREVMEGGENRTQFPTQY